MAQIPAPSAIHMLAYIARRTLIAIPLLLAITFITFMVMQLAPGNFFDRLRLDPQISEETIERYEALYHLDEPLPLQYFHWIKNILHGNLGYSFFYNAPVSKIIFQRIFNTFILSLSALIFTWICAIPLGIICAKNANRPVDRLVSGCSFIGLSIPSFFLAILLIYGASQVNILPLGGMRSANFELFSTAEKIFDVLKHLIIPTFALSLGSIASLTRIMRSNLVETLRKPFILMSRAKGLPERSIFYKHGLKNALNPLVTIFGYQLSGLLSGAAITEIICNWPGLGQVMLTAVRAQDVYLVMASVLFGGAMLLCGNLLADVLLAWTDPRIRYE